MNKQQTFRLPASARPALLLLAAFLFYAPTLDAQVVKFQKTYAPTDLPAWGYCVQQTADGGYITAGWSNDEFPGYRDALLVKTSAAGVLQWTFDYDLFGPNYSHEEARYVIEVDDRVNGVFDGTDAAIFGTFYDPSSSVSLPEPAALGILAVAGAGLLARRRRA